MFLQPNPTLISQELRDGWIFHESDAAPTSVWDRSDVYVPAAEDADRPGRPFLHLSKVIAGSD